MDDDIEGEALTDEEVLDPPTDFDYVIQQAIKALRRGPSYVSVAEAYLDMARLVYNREVLFRRMNAPAPSDPGRVSC